MIERKRSRYLWSEENVNGTRMGRYLTGIESCMISSAFDELGWPNAVLDIGGGDGRLDKVLIGKGVKPVILEYDPVPLEEIVQKKWCFPLLRADGNTLPIKSNSLDAAMAFEIAECTNAAHNVHFFKEVYRVLRKHGIFLIESDNRSSLIGLVSEWGENRGKQKEHRLYYSEGVSETKKKLIAAGFQIKMVKGFRWIPFNRTSDNQLIPLFAIAEKCLKLGNIINYSPWIFWAAIK